MISKLKLRVVENEVAAGNGAVPPAVVDAAPAARADPRAATAPSAVVGECIDARHPTLPGRARIRWAAGEGLVCERWIPLLMTVTVRTQDRVLLVQPSNWEEPVIVGVLDGFATRPVRPASGGPVIELQNDEAVRIQSRDGQELLELAMSEAGPVVRLLSTAVGLNLPGKLSISADSIELRARKGEVLVAATDDVVVTGATVRLN